jgi:hypothetical protein
LETYEALVRNVVLRVAGRLIELGRASFEVIPAGGTSPPGAHGKYDPGSPAEFKLTPANPQACPLWIAVDMPGEAYVGVGHRGTQFEIWSKDDLTYFESHLEAIVRAVVGGDYEEWVNRASQRLKAAGFFLREPGLRIYHNVFWFPRWRKRTFKHVGYEPY